MLRMNYCPGEIRELISPDGIRMMKAAQNGMTIRSEEEDTMRFFQLILGILVISCFFISWLVFKRIDFWDWIILGLGVSDLVHFFSTGKKEEKKVTEPEQIAASEQ